MDKIYRGKRAVVSKDRQSKLCTNCYKMLHKDYFHKSTTGALGLFHICKKCRCQREYQKQLEKKLLQGCKSVVECAKCECYMMKKLNTNLCRRCNQDEMAHKIH